MTRVERFDAIVVGAGPSGSATALLLARAGYRILLLDRRDFPRAKACGDCLSAGATRILHDLGVLPRIEMEGPARLTGWRIISPSGRDFYHGFEDLAPADPFGGSALALPRERLDSILLDAARRAGAEVRTGVRVVDLVRASQGEVTGVRTLAAGGETFLIHARLVVGADGLRSIVARRLELVQRLPRLRKISLTAHLTGIRGLGTRGEMHLASGACVGLAPVAGSPRPRQPMLYNLTLVVDGDRFAREIARAGTGPFFHSMLRHFPQLRDRLPQQILSGGITLPHQPAGARPWDHQTSTDAPVPSRPEPADSRLQLLASGPFDWPTRAVIAPGAALVGDAAGYYDPFTGQGIYQGLAAALILAEEAAAALGTGQGQLIYLHYYARRRAQLLRGARIVQRLIESVIARPALANHAIAKLDRAPLAAAALLAITGDLRPARSLLSPRIALDLLIPSTK
jgi:flavin-dependent dehydrogenase